MSPQQSPFQHNVADLLRSGAEPRPVHLEVPVDWHIDLTRVVLEPPLTADLMLSMVGGGILARGSVSYLVRHVCHRCLDEWEEPAEIRVTALFAEKSLEDEDDYELNGKVIDLEPMLRDEVILAMPLLPTCRPDCPGLVDSGQIELNTATPDAEGESTSPFAMLKDLLQPGE